MKSSSAPFLALLIYTPGLAGQATIREEPQSIRTYPFSGPNQSATRPGGHGVQQRIYPYFQFDSLTSSGVNETRNPVRLENRYIYTAQRHAGAEIGGG